MKKLWATRSAIPTKHLSRSSLSFARQQKGAGMIFCALFIPVLGIAIILLANISQLVFEKIRLQQTVDQAVLSAANIQSIGLNEIADLNYAAIEEYTAANRALKPAGHWFNAGVAQTAVNYHQQIFNWIDFYRRDANRNYAALAHEYAQDVVTTNLPNMDVRLERVSGASNSQLTTYRETRERPISYRFYTSFCSRGFSGSPCTSNTNIWTLPSRPDITGNRNGARRVIPGYVTGLMTNFFNPVVRWQKGNENTYAAYKLTQRQKRFAIGSSFLKDIYPEISVYAAAKPTGGNLYQITPTYVSRLEHLQNLTPTPGVPNLSRVDH